MLLNALAVPILSLATLIALYVMDRRLDWLWRLRPLVGIPLMLAIAAPWLLIRAHFDGGVPFSGLTWGEFIRALGGAQDMKWKAAPLTFTLAFLLGFLPGAVLLWPALQNLWRERGDALQRFLFAWIVGYWLYLELIASKPALYTVQAMFPAAAAAVALVLDRGLPEAAWQSGKLAIPPRMLRLPAWLVMGGTIAMFAAIVNIARAPSTFLIVVGATLVAVLFTFAARAAGEWRAAAWLTTSVAGFALFIVYTFAVLMPSAEIGWPAPRIAEAVAPLRRCVIGPVGVVGFREPSDHLRPRPRRQRQSRYARRLDGGRRGRHRRRRGPLAARSRQGAGRARRQGPAAPRLRRSLQRDARLPARLLHLCHRPRCARPRLQGGRGIRLLDPAAVAARRRRPQVPLPLVASRPT